MGLPTPVYARELNRAGAACPSVTAENIPARGEPLWGSPQHEERQQPAGLPAFTALMAPTLLLGTYLWA